MNLTLKNRLPGIIALVALTVFSGLTIYAFFQLGKNGNPYNDLAKEGFVLIGGVLTTVVGYYFGNKSAEKVTSAVREEAEKNRQMVKNMVPYNRQQP